MKRILLGALVVMVVGFAAWRWWQHGREALPEMPSAADTTGAGVRAVTLWFGAADGSGLVSERRELPDAPALHDRVSSLIAELDRGPRSGAVAVLPAGTYLLHVYSDDRGLVTCDLSRSFVQGFHGGSTAEWLAVASLVRTIGDNVPGVKRVLFVCGGAPIPTLGGHLPLDRPLDVSEWP